MRIISASLIIFAFNIQVVCQSLLKDSLLLSYDSRYLIKTTLKNQGYTIISLGRNYAGHYYCYVYIKGKCYNFIIDTGASHSMIRKSIADSLGLNKVEGLKISTLDIDLTNIETYACNLDSFYIGNFFIDSLSIIVDKKFEIMARNGFNEFLNYLKFNQKITTTRGLGLEDGIIGNDILNKYCAFIDIKNLELYLKPNVKIARK